MYVATMRRVGGSISLTIPPAILDMLGVREGSRVALDLLDGNLVVRPRKRPRYRREDLLAKCDPSLSFTAEERAWLDAPPVGLEVI